MIFALLIFFIAILSIRAIPNFKVIKTSYKNNYYIIMPDGIYYLNNINYNMNKQYEFNITEQIESQEQFDYINLYPLLNNSFLFIAKNNYIYFFYENENKIIFTNYLNDNEIYSSQIFPTYIENDIYFPLYYFTVFVDINKNLNIYYSVFKFYDDSENEKMTSLNFNIDSKYFSCQLFYGYNLTCFYKRENSMLLEANTFILGDNSNIEISSNSSILLKNNRTNINIKSIKSILSQDIQYLSLVCYILDDNNNCECLLYDYSLNKFNDYGNYLDNCLSNFTSLDIISYNIQNKKEYILYCFISETEINLVKLNEDFQIIENNGNGIYYINNTLIKNCSEFYLSYLFYKTDSNNNDFYIFGNCDNMIKEYKLIKNETIGNNANNNSFPTYNNSFPSYNNSFPSYNNSFPTNNNPFPSYNNSFPTKNDPFPTYNSSSPSQQYNPSSNNSFSFEDFNMSLIPLLKFNDSFLFDIGSTKEDLIIEEKNNLYHITSSYNQNNINNKNTVNLGGCEKILKNYYNISENDSLLILKIEEFEEELSTSRIYYEFYDQKTKKKLNLTLCEDLNFKIDLNITIDEGDILKYEHFRYEVNKIINSFEIGKDYEINNNNGKASLRPINSYILGNSTYIDFTECEKILRNHYSISSDRILSFLLIELNNNDNNSLVNKVEYQIFDDNKNILNLSLCSETNIKIYYSLKDFILSDIEIENLKKFKENNIDLLNLNNSFFNDICYPYSEGDSDLTLKDRIKYFSKLFNLSLCEDNCVYDNIDLENMTISCICTIKSEMDLNRTKDDKEKKEANVQIVVMDTVKDSTYEVIRCTNLVFFMNKKNNCGFWLYSILVLMHIPMIISYLIYKEEPIKNYIMKEMEKFHYIPEIKNPLKKKLKGNKNKKIKKIKIKMNIILILLLILTLWITLKQKPNKKNQKVEI